MSNETDLDWLARNLHYWALDTDLCIVYRGNKGQYRYEFSERFGFTKAQWLARRAELQNKPGWSDAPEWATNLVQICSGAWVWCDNDRLEMKFGGGDRFERSASYGEVIGDWRDTLEKRPEQTISDICSEITGENRHEEIFDPFVSVEDAKITIMQSDGDVKNFGGIIGRSLPLKEDAATAKQPSITLSKYTKTIHGVPVDVYDVLQAWGVINPALQHLIKKALQCGQRGHKDNEQDLQDIIDSAIRAKELG